MNSRLIPGIALASLTLALMTVPAAAHHGWGGQATEHFELTGTVEVPVSLAGPHATMKIRADGKVWDITLAPASRTSRAGLTEKTLPVGAEVTIRGHRNLDQNRLEVKTERVTYNGKLYDVYPERD